MYHTIMNIPQKNSVHVYMHYALYTSKSVLVDIHLDHSSNKKVEDTCGERREVSNSISIYFLPFIQPIFLFNVHVPIFFEYTN